MNPELLVSIFSYGALFLQATIAVGGLLYLAQKLTSFEYTDHAVLDRLHEETSNYHLHLAFVLSLIATGGSLYLSNVLGWEPCHLCWFQRIFMYPLVLLTGTGLLLEKDDVAEYALPLVMIGGSISIYHYAVQMLSKVSSGCSTLSASCSDKFTYYFGYMTIPMFALTAFLGIGILLWKFNNKN
ncbi:disulfide oxidoreductase [Candidatus Nanohalovita haloferacivicina]|uniref:disulfide oxidoreductase n=1 Tax=Candidatus Nanohalovita haloferacivicina TaxID=2978046 RepID=UPI00325FD44C|nr:Disulfide bond formation protein DsbB [Candidatus Nanohalobia archaeon BNXNv]